jgi:hypothetical protein
MIGRNTLFQPKVAEKAFRPLIFAAHPNPYLQGISQMHRITLQSPRKPTFSAAC